jgi:hypothetical protein
MFIILLLSNHDLESKASGPRYEDVDAVGRGDARYMPLRHYQLEP